MQITRCRLAGGEVVDFASDSQVPVVLYPALGSTAAGPCWYYTSSPSGLWIVVLYPNGDVDLAYGTNPGEVTPVGVLSRCTSEPVVAPDPLTVVWDYLTEYLHAPPEPELSPPPGDGITGMETYAAVVVPPPHRAQLTAGVTGVEVEVEVAQVIVVWGDGTVTSHSPGPEVSQGFPGGTVFHIYERKQEATVSVSYVWAVRWRVLSGSWSTLAVPDTITTVDYPVSEIVSVLRP